MTREFISTDEPVYEWILPRTSLTRPGLAFVRTDSGWVAAGGRATTETATSLLFAMAAALSIVYIVYIGAGNNMALMAIAVVSVVFPVIVAVMFNRCGRTVECDSQRIIFARRDFFSSSVFGFSVEDCTLCMGEVRRAIRPSKTSKMYKVAVSAAGSPDCYELSGVLPYEKAEEYISKYNDMLSVFPGEIATCRYVIA